MGGEKSIGCIEQYIHLLFKRAHQGLALTFPRLHVFKGPTSHTIAHNSPRQCSPNSSVSLYPVSDWEVTVIDLGRENAERLDPPLCDVTKQPPTHPHPAQPGWFALADLVSFDAETAVASL